MLGRITQDLQNVSRRIIERTQLFGILQFRDAHFNELKKLIKVHQHHFREYWDKRQSEDSAKKEQSHTLNYVNILDVDYDKRKPKATTEIIASCFNFDDTVSITDISNHCYGAFKILNKAVAQRVDSSTLNEPSNGATVIFCAELSQWLNLLARRSIEQSLYDEVLQRINYLNGVLEEPVFEDEPLSDYQIQKIIYLISEILEQDILPIIKCKVNAKSSRDHFDDLSKHASAFIQHTVNFLFYIFSDAKDVKSFDFINVSRLITSNEELNISLNSRFGEAILLIKALNENLNNSSKLTFKFSKANDFIESDGNLRNERLTYLLPSTKTAKSLGIIDIIAQRTDLLEIFLKISGLLVDYSLLIAAFRRAYHLAGAGGDNLIYNHLYSETLQLISSYSNIELKITHLINLLMSSCKEIYKASVLTGNNNEWRKNFLASKTEFDKASKQLKICKLTIADIYKCLDSFHTDKNKDNILSTISEYLDLIREIAIRNNISDVTHLLSSQSASRHTQTLTNIKVLTTTDNNTGDSLIPSFKPDMSEQELTEMLNATDTIIQRYQFQMGGNKNYSPGLFNLSSSSISGLVGLPSTSRDMSDKLLTLVHKKIDDHWYTGDEIRRLMQNIIMEHQDIELLTDMLGNDWTAGNTLKDQLIQFNTQRALNISQRNPVKDKIIIPVNLGTIEGHGIHWVLLYINYQKDLSQLPNLIYIDPFGKKMPEEIHNHLQDKKLFPNVNVDNNEVPLQNDDYNCGPWIVIAAQFFVGQSNNEKCNISSLMVHLKDCDINALREEQQRLLRTQIVSHKF